MVLKLEKPAKINIIYSSIHKFPTHKEKFAFEPGCVF